MFRGLGMWAWAKLWSAFGWYGMRGPGSGVRDTESGVRDAESGVRCKVKEGNWR